MPGSTDRGIIFPVKGDKITSLSGWFAQQASSVNDALDQVYSDFEEPDYPAPLSVKGADQQYIPATAWADLPNMASIDLDLPRACWVNITLGAWVVATAGDTRVSSRVTGATTLGETQLEVGGANTAWGQVIYVSSGAASNGGTSTRFVRLNAGSNKITARAYGTGNGTRMANYATLQVAPIRWA